MGCGNCRTMEAGDARARQCSCEQVLYVMPVRNVRREYDPCMRVRSLVAYTCRFAGSFEHVGTLPPSTTLVLHYIVVVFPSRYSATQT